MAFLRGVDPDVDVHAHRDIPLIVFIAYQMMFAIITPALITGAFTNRVTFKAYLMFLVVWQLFVYFPFVHMIWGGGMLAQWGVLDFAGGIVVHAIAGLAALASVLYVGRARFVDAPHSIPLVALGTGLLWFGWYGFNAGSEFRVDSHHRGGVPEHRRRSLVRGDRLAVDRVGHAEKPNFLGLLTGAVAGLATITPAAGLRSPIDAVRDHRHRRRASSATARSRSRTGCSWDDALDVWGVHGVGGLLGIVLLGVFASTAFNPAGGDGLIHGSAAFFVKQVVAAFGCSVYAFAFTYVMLKVIDRVTPVRVGEEAEQGLDEAMHGESAYEDAPPIGGVAPAL